MIDAHFQNIKDQLLSEILQADKSIRIAVAWFTNNELFEALLTKCRQKINVELVIINDSINIKRLGLNFNELIEEGALLYFGDPDHLMHHKFCIIDDSILINGSYNWTYWAETKNEENIIIIKEENSILEKFINEFNILTTRSSLVKCIDESMLTKPIGNYGFFNLRNIRLNEYIGSALDLEKRGNHVMSTMILKEANKINSTILKSSLDKALGSRSNAVYQRVNSITSEQVDEYTRNCNDVCNHINNGNFLKAIELADMCSKKHPNKFSIYVYCGDAKSKLGDIEGSLEEYNKALNYTHTKNAKLIYYNKIYNHTFFPFADVCLKAGNRERASLILLEAVNTFKKENNKTDLELAEKYLDALKSNEEAMKIV